MRTDERLLNFSPSNVRVVAESTTRNSTIHGGDDKLACAGNSDSYVRGVIA